MAVRIVVCGARGRMGHTIGRLALASSDVHIVGGIDHAANDASGDDDYPQIVEPDQAGDLLRSADVVLDFSAPGALSALLDKHADALEGRALVVGTTGLDADARAHLDKAAQK